MRYRTKYFARISVFFTVALFSYSVYAQEFREGVDYHTLSGDPVILNDERVEVIEFFWFGCPSCFRFEQFLLAWDKPETIHFVNVPALLNRSAEFHAIAYYALELMGLKEQLMQSFYDEIHVKKNRLVGVEALEKWASNQPGVDAVNLVKTTSSFAAITKLSQAKLLANKYNISSVPTLVVAGKYRTSPAMAGSGPRSLQVVEFLAKKALAEK